MKKKLQFLFSVVALLLVATVAKAQGFAEGKYYFQNVESGRYLGSGNSWGTEASLLKNPDYLTLIANTDGTYKIESQVSNGGKINFGEGYMDNGNPYALTFTAVGDYYTMAAGDNYFGWNGTSTVLGQNLASNSPNALWKIIPEADMIASLETATADKPVDATFLITDHTFGRNHRYVSAWTNEGGAALTGGNSNKHCAEKYHGVFNVYQKLTGAPAGVYKFTAQGFYRQDGSDNENLPVFYANSETSTFPVKTGSENSMADACTSFEKGLYAADAIYVQVTNAGELTVGVKLVTNTSLWCIWDNFELTYYGPDADLASLKFGGLVSQVTELREQATALKSNEAVSAGTVTALEAALEGSETIEATEDAYKAAIAALTKAVEQANLDIDNKAAIEAMYALMENTNVYTADAYTTYKALADDYLEKYNAGTLTETVVNPSAVTGWHAANNYDDLLLSAWSIGGEQCADFTKGLYINTWSVEGETDGTDFKVPFFEYFGDAANSLGATTLSATMEGLTPGLYQVTAWVRNQPKNNVVAADITGINLQVNDGDAVDATEGEVKGGFNIGEFSAAGIVGEDGKLVIKVNVTDQNNSHWLSFKNVKYTYRAPVYAVAVADGIENGTVKAEPTLAAEGDKVTLTIQPAAGYELDELSVKNGENDVEVAEDYTFTMPAGAVSVSASFKEPAVPPTTYAITIAEGIENGTVEADPTEAAEGATVTLTIEPAAGYELDEISVKNGEDDVEVAADSTFIMPAGAVLVSATFKEIPINEASNLDFATDEAESIGVRTYKKDVKGSEKAQLQPVTGWSIANNGDARAGGIFAYGSEAYLGGEGYAAPATDPEGNAGQALGLVGVWSADVQYTQTITLTPGTYMVEVPVYNAGGSTAISKNYIGANGTYATTTQYPVGQWKKEQVKFTLTETQDVTISLGYLAANSGSAAMPHLFIDGVTIYDEAAIAAAELAAAKSNILTTIDALSPIGDRYFEYTQADIDEAKIAIEAATSVEEVEAVAIPIVKAPTAEQFFTFQLKEGGMYMAINEGIKLAEEAATFAIVPTEGGYAITNGSEYVAFTGTGNNTWSMGATTTAYAWNIKSLGDGTYTIAKASNSADMIGVDNTGAGSSCYANKSGDNAIWTIAEYVDPTTYAITIFDGIQNGSVVADAEEAEEGATVKLTISPDEGYELTALSVKAGEDDVEVAEGYTFVMPAAAVTVFATFKNPNDYTNMIVNADLTGEGGFDATGTKGIDGSGVVKVGNAAAFDFKQTIANLPAGQYKLTAQAAYRYGGDEAAEAAAIAGGTETKLVQLYATVGEKTVAAPVQNRYDGASETDYANGEGSVVVNEKYVPNSTNAVKAWFAAGQYVNEVIFNIAEAGDVTIGINRTGTPESDYTVIGPWTLTRLGDAEIPEIALNAPTFNVEEGTQAEPNMLPAGSTLKITYTADNLAENGVDADDVKVRMTVLVSGDLPENLMNMQSETKHSVMRETFYIPLGETDFPVALKEGYVYQNIVVMAAALVKQGETPATDEELAEYAGEPVQLHWVGLEAPVPEIALNAPTFNVEEGTQAEPNMLPAGSTLKITYTADNLAENGVDADDVMVRMTVLVSGDLPENLMNMQSETKHSVMRETFYIPLGETDFPVALKEGYVYQNIVVMEAALVKQGETPAADEKLAEYAGEPVQLHWVGLEAPATATYAITVADEIEGGEVEADVEEAAEGAKVTLTITPDQNYKLGTVTVSYVEGEGAETKYVEVAEDYTFTMPAAPVTVSATFTYVDPNLIEIAQETNQEAGGVVTLATKEEFDDYTLYTFKDQVCVAIKILNVDVTGCDYVVVKFAEPVPAGIKASFVDGEGNEEIPEGATEIKNVIATNTSVQNGIMPQITILTIWDGNGKSVKVTGVYKHLAEEPDAIDAIETAEDVKADGKYMENGKLVIIKNGHKYNASGLRIK